MRLLRNIRKSGDSIGQVIEEDGEYYFCLLDMPSDIHMTKAEIEEETRELTLDEQVDYLYNLALNGSAKEYREILDWLYWNAHNREEDKFSLCLRNIETGNDPDKVYESYVRKEIKQALAEQNKQ